MLGGADNPNGELPSYITGANNVPNVAAGLTKSTRAGLRRSRVHVVESLQMIPTT